MERIIRPHPFTKMYEKGCGLFFVQYIFSWTVGTEDPSPTRGLVFAKTISVDCFRCIAIFRHNRAGCGSHGHSRIAEIAGYPGFGVKDEIASLPDIYTNQ